MGRISLGVGGAEQAVLWFPIPKSAVPVSPVLQGAPSLLPPCWLSPASLVCRPAAVAAGQGPSLAFAVRPRAASPAVRVQALLSCPMPLLLELLLPQQA